LPAYPRIIAHRCGGAAAPENTLAGLRAAARLGGRGARPGVEFDVMLSRDGVPVLIHDESLERTTDGRGRVADHDLAELKRLDAGVALAPAFCGERIPSLAEAWQLCAELGLWANVEIKPAAGHDAETGAAVGRFLAARRRRDAGIVSSFSDVALQACADEAPDIPRALLVDAIPPDWRERLARNGCVALHCAAPPSALPAGLEEVLAAGIPVACYTVNSRAAGDRLLAAGVAAIFTDRPDLW
jgi:glycerophosphoryl diester phosphodiesterase